MPAYLFTDLGQTIKDFASALLILPALALIDSIITLAALLIANRH